MSKRGLGKGLDALLATSALARESKASQQPETKTHDGELQELVISQLQPGVYQPRKDMQSDALEELASSIQSQGIIQPIVVRRVGEQRYEIIAGERRWRAARKAGLSHVPCLVKNVQDRAAIAMALIENIQREDLNAIEEAQALERLQTEFELSHHQVAEVIGKSRATVSNLLRLNQLELEVKQLVERKMLDMGHARALLALEGEQQVNVAEQVSNKNLTVRQTEQLVKKHLNPPEPAIIVPPHPQSDTWCHTLSQQFDAKVTINSGADGSAKLLITVDDKESLESLIKKLQSTHDN
jgi:ParB family chromosome partitioning protein